MVMGELGLETEVLVIGSGPGGYAAAFRAADLGLEVTMVDTATRPGGVCLFKGCIPSKTFLYLSELIYDARKAEAMGIAFGQPQINLEALRKWKASVIDRLADGLAGLSDKRGVQRIKGRAEFENSNTVRMHGSEVSHIKFRHAVLAIGSSPIAFPGTAFETGKRIMSSAGALALTDIPDSILVMGGGYVGLELGTVYAALGSKVSLIEMKDRLLAGVDEDLIRHLQKRLGAIFEDIRLNTRVTALEEHEKGVDVRFEGDGGESHRTFDRVLVAIGRKPNTREIGLENTGVNLDEKGFVIVDDQLHTADERIYAVGDVIGGYMLAHKAMREGKVAAEVIAGQPSVFDVRAIPAVVYTDPQIAWCGLTEEQARRQNIKIEVQRFPWKFSGRAATMGAPEGFTKIIVEPQTQRILGVGITGRDTEGLISEGVLAVEMGALAQDMGLSLHPHPTLSETEGEAAEIFMGSATHILSRAGKTRSQL